jgi:TRAP-type C4-dicarboxylate transport system permease small subunit
MSDEKGFNSTVRRFNTVLGAIAGFGILCLSAVIFFEIISRKMFGHPTIWCFDTSIYLFLLVSFLSISYTMEEDGHVGFSFLVQRLRRFRVCLKVFTVISGIFGGLFCFVLFYVSMEVTIMAFRLQWVTQAQVPIPVFYLYAIMCFGSLALSVTFLRKIVARFFSS